jgi:hypothetical protein
VKFNPQSNADFTQVTCTVHFYYIITISNLNKLMTGGQEIEFHEIKTGGRKFCKNFYEIESLISQNCSGDRKWGQVGLGVKLGKVRLSKKKP